MSNDININNTTMTNNNNTHTTSNKSRNYSVNSNNTTNTTMSSTQQQQRSSKISKIGNEYTIIHKLGIGSFASVILCIHDKTQQYYAIKKISKTKLNTNNKYIENLNIEIKVMKSMNHINIVNLHKKIESNNHIYLVLEYCNGGDLSKLFKRSINNSNSSNNSNKPTDVPVIMDEQLAQYYFIELCKGLYYLRSNQLIHRDLKPQNLLLHDNDIDNRNVDKLPIAYNNNNYPRQLKIADFGFARQIQPDTMVATLCGSPLYMAPEILRYEKYDEKIDLWSIGVILYEMIYHRTPYNGNNHIHLLQNIEAQDVQYNNNINVSNDCIDLLNKLLKRNPKQRINYSELFNHPWLKGEIITHAMYNQSPNIDENLIKSIAKIVEQDNHQSIQATITNTDNNIITYNDSTKQNYTTTEPINITNNKINDTTDDDTERMIEPSPGSNIDEFPAFGNDSAGLYDNNDSQTSQQLQRNTNNNNNNINIPNTIQTIPVAYPVNQVRNNNNNNSNTKITSNIGPFSTSNLSSGYVMVDRELSPVNTSPYDSKSINNTQISNNNQHNKKLHRITSNDPLTLPIYSPPLFSTTNATTQPNSIISQQQQTQQQLHIRQPSGVFTPQSVQMQYTTVDRAYSQPPQLLNNTSLQPAILNTTRNITSPPTTPNPAANTTTISNNTYQINTIDVLLNMNDNDAVVSIDNQRKRIHLLIDEADKTLRSRRDSLNQSLIGSQDYDNANNSSGSSNSSLTKSKQLQMLEATMKAMCYYCKSIELLSQLYDTINQYKNYHVQQQQQQHTTNMHLSGLINELDRMLNNIHIRLERIKNKAIQCKNIIDNEAEKLNSLSNNDDNNSLDIRQQLYSSSIDQLLFNDIRNKAKQATIAEFQKNHHECIIVCQTVIALLHILFNDILLQPNNQTYQQWVGIITKLLQQAELHNQQQKLQQQQQSQHQLTCHVRSLSLANTNASSSNIATSTPTTTMIPTAI